MPFSYSPATRGFYDGKSGMVPTDAVEVSADRHAALISAQAAGAEIVPGPDGAPVELWRPAPTEAELLAAKALRCRSGHIDSAFVPGQAILPYRHLSKGAVDVDADHESHARLPCQ